MRKLGIIFGVFFFFINTAHAEVALNILKGKATASNKAALFLSVLDDAGRPIKGLSKENLKLLISGEEIKDFILEPVSTTQEHLSIILGIDVSGSMKGKPFEETQKAISIFLDQLDKEDFISLVSFGIDVKFITDFTNRKHEIREKVESLKPIEAWTHLYDATFEGIEKGKKAPTTRVAFILLTDGRDEKSNRKRDQAVNIATGASMPVFTIGFGHEIDDKYLDEIAKVSGGYFLSTPEPEKIADLYNKVLDQLKNQYMISFDFSKEPATYKAVLRLEKQGKAAEAERVFLFNPSGEPLVLPAAAPPKPEKPLWERTEVMIYGGIGLLMILFVVGFFYLQDRRRKEVEKKLQEELGGILNKIRDGTKTEECEIEFPPGNVPTGAKFLQIWSESLGSATDVQDMPLPGAFLKIDCVAGGGVPLEFKNMDRIEEVIIARRRSPNDKYMKSDKAVYLWVPEKNRVVSRPTETRLGHVRILFSTDRNRYVLEDLGSGTKTLYNGKDIKGLGDPIPLENHDVIEIGEAGIRIEYRERYFPEGGSEEANVTMGNL